MNKKKESTERIRISVRNLVEFIFRGGDIDNRRRAAGDRQAMEAGSRIHRQIQRQMGSSYQSEVTLRCVVVRPSVTLQLEGRADGIFSEPVKRYQDKLEALHRSAADFMIFPDLHKEEDAAEKQTAAFFSSGELLKRAGKTLWVIDEIKGVYRDLRQLKKPVPVHQAQALCYGLIYAREHHLPVIGVQMTYCHLETEEIRRFYDLYPLEALERWFEELIAAYEKWAMLELQMRKDLKESLAGMQFPFPYRPGQRKLAVWTYRSIEQGVPLFIQAPTGIGKTMSTLFPALKAMGEGRGGKVFYLTAKTITRTVAEEAFDILREQGLKIHSVTITAKEKICPLETCDCNPEGCPRAKGHFDRVNEALFALLSTESRMDRDAILACAAAHQVCPFELNLDLTLWSQGIICDYNYVFDPEVYLRRFFTDGMQGDYIFLVDEAHNLVERARQMYSAVLIKEEVRQAMIRFQELQTFEAYDTPAAMHAAGRCVKALKRLNRKLLEWKGQTTGNVRKIDVIKPLYEASQRAQDCISSYLEETVRQPGDEEMDFYFRLRHFNSICEILDGHYIPYCSVEDGQFQVRLLCANPAANIDRCISRGIGAIFFSATMLPMHYYRKLLTEQETARAIYVDSPFSQKKRLLAIAQDVSSRYAMRGPGQYRRVAAYIFQMTESRNGNYMVFFPSYSYLEEVAALCSKRWEGGPVTLLLQKPGMTEEEKEQFLQAFYETTYDHPEPDDHTERNGRLTPDDQSASDAYPEPDGSRCVVGFCVLGGIFSEGIDLCGDRLIGALVVGTGLPQPGTEGALLQEYFQQKGYNGYDFACRFPGINRVFQAAGRVIRSQEDRGVILLLDYRMLQADHVRLFPMDWDDYQVVDCNRIEGLLSDFWKRMDSEKEKM